MKGLQIFVHSIRLVFTNLNAAFRVSLILMIVQVAALFALGLSVLLDETAMEIAMTQGTFPWGRGIVMLVVVIVASLWLTIGWHRYILKAEMPKGWLPAWHGARMMAYVRKSLILILISIPLAIALGFLAVPFAMLFAGDPGSAGGPSRVGLMVIGLILGGIFALIFYRLTLVLPAAAVGRSLSLGEAWTATQGAMGALLVLAVLSVIGSALLHFPATAILGTETLPGQLWEMGAYWIEMMVGISIITTLYGHYVEERPLG